MLTSRMTPPAIEPATTTLCHLKDKATGEYLHWSAQTMTTKKDERWQGTTTQALVCREKFDIAKSLTMVAVIPTTPKPQEYR